MTRKDNEIDGWDITIWIEAKEGRNKAEEIFNAVMEFIEDKFDIHHPDEPCVLSWLMSMREMYFDEEEV